VKNLNLLMMRERLGRPIDIDEQPFIDETLLIIIYRLVSIQGK